MRLTINRTLVNPVLGRAELSRELGDASAVLTATVWTAPAVSVPHSGGERPVIGEVLRSWPERLDRRLEQITGLWAGRDNIQGGHTS